MTKRLPVLAFCHSVILGAAVYFSPAGQQRNPGREHQPVATLAVAQKLV